MPPVEIDQWEYARVNAATTNIDGLIERLNALGTYGWEVVGFASSDKTIGLNALHAVLRRRICPLPPPDDVLPGWKPDPSGRHEQRYWTGALWTREVVTGGFDHDDAPTTLTEPWNPPPSKQRRDAPEGGTMSPLCRIGQHGSKCTLSDCSCGCHR